MGVFWGLTSTLSRCSCSVIGLDVSLFLASSFVVAHLVQTVGIEQDPTKLDEFCGILSHVDTVFIAGSRNMDDQVPVDLKRLGRLRSHGGCRVA